MHRAAGRFVLSVGKGSGFSVPGLAGFPCIPSFLMSPASAAVRRRAIACVDEAPTQSHLRPRRFSFPPLIPCDGVVVLLRAINHRQPHGLGGAMPAQRHAAVAGPVLEGCVLDLLGPSSRAEELRRRFRRWSAARSPGCIESLAATQDAPLFPPVGSERAALDEAFSQVGVPWTVRRRQVRRSGPSRAKRPRRQPFAGSKAWPIDWTVFPKWKVVFWHIQVSVPVLPSAASLPAKRLHPRSGHGKPPTGRVATFSSRNAPWLMR